MKSNLPHSVKRLGLALLAASLLATLGTILMLATLATSMDLSVHDGPVYLREVAGAAAEAPPPPLGRGDAPQMPRSDAEILKDLKGTSKK